MKKQIVLFSSAFIFFSCSNHTQEQESKIMKNDSLAIDSASLNTKDTLLVEESDEISLPSPLRIATTFKRSGLKFIDASLNPTESAQLYQTTHSRALNLGVYSADMAYCLLNKQYAQSKNYLKTCKELGGQLGLNSAFEANNLAARFEKNMGKDDSLIKLVSDLQLETDLLLEQNKQAHVSALIFTGAWLETVHSAAKVYLKGELKMTPVILEQTLLINDIIKVLEKQKEKDEKIAELVSDLDAIRIEFKNIEELKKVDLSEVDFSEIKLKANALNVLCEKIETIRTKIIKG